MLPIIGAVVGGLVKNGLGLLANVVKKKGKEFIEEKTGIKLEDTDNLSEEQLFKLKEFELAHEEELLKISLEDKKLDIEEQKIFLDDVKDARDMQKEALNQDDIFSKRFVYYYASVMSILAFGYIIAITFIPIPTQGVRFADVALGFCLATVMGSIINYLYGSSSGSKQKSLDMNNIIDKVKK